MPNMMYKCIFCRILRLYYTGRMMYSWYINCCRVAVYYLADYVAAERLGPDDFKVTICFDRKSRSKVFYFSFFFFYFF